MSERVESQEKLILVVDDDLVFLNSCVEFFAREGFRTASARDGNEALKKIKEAKPDLIILDLLLPGLSGYEVVKKLQEDYFAKSIPIIVVTIKKMDPGSQRMFKMESNVKDLLSKPINLHILTIKIHQLLHTIPKDEKILEEYRKKVAEEKK